MLYIVHSTLSWSVLHVTQHSSKDVISIYNVLYVCVYIHVHMCIHVYVDVYSESLSNQDIIGADFQVS